MAIINDSPSALGNAFHNNPAQFRATGRGWFNRLPNIRPTTNNRTGCFVLGGVHDNFVKGNIARTHNLWVMDVETGYTITGDTGQSKIGRTYYTKNLHQDALTIQGVVPNMFEYDRLVEFIVYHQEKVANDAKFALNFKLFPHRLLLNPMPDGSLPPSPFWRNISPGISVEGIVQNIEAGHERFKNVILWSIDLMITNDFLQKGQVVTEIALDAVLKKQYEKIFGSRFQDASVAEGTPQPPAQSSLDQSDLSSNNADFFGNNLFHV